MIGFQKQGSVRSSFACTYGLSQVKISVHFSPLYSISNLSVDANGNVADLVNAEGNLTAHYEYDPYGNVITKTGTLADVNPYRFSTKYTDGDTGLLYYGCRFYSAILSIWMCRDPIGENGGRNLYVYVANDAINWIDALGNDTPIPIGGPFPGGGEAPLIPYYPPYSPPQSSDPFECPLGLIRDPEKVKECQQERYIHLESATAVYAAGLLGCGLSPSTPIAKVACIAGVTLAYGIELAFIEKDYDACIRNAPCVCP